MAWPTDITAADRGRTLEVVFDDGETVRLTAEALLSRRHSQRRLSAACRLRGKSCPPGRTNVDALRRPEAIWLFSTPVIRSVARPVSRMFGNWLFRRMYWWQVGRFIRDADVRREFVPLLYRQFDATPSARPAFFRLNEDLLPMVRSRTQLIPKLKELRRPVRIIFGDADPSLNSGVARTFHEFLPGSELFLIQCQFSSRLKFGTRGST